MLPVKLLLLGLIKKIAKLKEFNILSYLIDHDTLSSTSQTTIVSNASSCQFNIIKSCKKIT